MHTRLVVTAVLVVGAVVQASRGAVVYAKAELAEILLARAWKEARSGTEHPRPWPWADTWPTARLALPKQNWSAIVLDGASGRELAFAPGRLHGSAQPGAPGACVIAGHRDTHFAVLRHVVPGDPVELEDRRGVIHRYRVRRTAIVDEIHHGIRRDPETPELVLVTCWPFDTMTAGGPWRFVIWADPVL